MQHPFIERVWGLIAFVRIQYGVLKRREYSPIPVGLNSAQTRIHSTRESYFFHWLSLSLSTIAISLCFAAPASAAISYVQNNWTAPTGNSTTVSVAFSSAQTAGDLNVVVIGWGDSTATIQSVTDTKGNVYTRAVGPTVYTSVATQSVYYAKNIIAASAGSNTIKVTFSTAARLADLRVLEYAGLDTSSPLDVFAAGTGSNGSSSGTASSGAITTTATNELLVAADYGEPVTSAAGTGFTSRISDWDHNLVEDEMTSSTGTFTGTAAINIGRWVMQIVAFKAATGGGDTQAPTAPIGLTAIATSSAQINLSWTASTDNVGVTGYKVERCQGASCSTFAQIATPTTTTYSDTGLTTSTSYSYRVRATDAAGNLSGYSSVASATTQTTSDTTPPSAPTNLTTTAASSTQINLSWTASTDNVGVTGYKVERCSGTSCSTFAQIATPTTTSYSDTSLTASTSYSYRIRATDAAGNLSGYSSTSSATTQAPPDTTPPSAPSGLSATTASSTQINLSWTASTDNVGVTGYRVERCSGASCSTFAQIASPTTTSYSDTGLIASTSYSYRVRATDAAGNLSAYSSTSSATTQALPDTTAPTVPSGLIASATSGSQINVSWTASTDNVGVTGYKLERCTGTSCSSFTQIVSLTTTSYSDVGLSASTPYTYRVRATDAAGNLSGYSNTASATTQTPPGAPTGLTITASSDNEVDLAWNAASGSQTITSYQVLRCQGAGCSSYSSVASVTTLTDYDSSLSAGTSYSYEVIAVDSAGNTSSSSNVVTVTTVNPGSSCK